MQFFQTTVAIALACLLSASTSLPLSGTDMMQVRDDGSGSSSSSAVAGLLGSSAAAASSSNGTSAASSSSCEFLAGCTSGAATACEQNVGTGNSQNIDGTTSSICGSSTNTASSGIVSLPKMLFRRFLKMTGQVV